MIWSEVGKEFLEERYNLAIKIFPRMNILTSYPLLSQDLEIDR